jgi:nitrous oxide reductase
MVSDGSKRREGQAESGRRDFLKLAGLGAAAGAAGAVATGGAPAAAAAEAAAPPARHGYRETPHVRKFYELARF